MKVFSVPLKALVVVFAGLLTAALLATCVAIGMFLYFDAQLPSAGHTESLDFSEPLRIYTADGKLIRRYGIKTRLPVTYDEIPHVLVEAIVAAEDDRFFEHPGVDYQGILRAAINLVITGTKSQGGSTITMQLARNLYLSPKRTYVRKIKEIILALKLESKLSKQRVLELYLNKIYLGSGAYGVAAAAKIYYDEKLSELTLAQAAMIAGLPKAPTTYSPLNHPELARQRRAYVLGRMLEIGKISQGAYKQAMAQPVIAAPQPGSAKDERVEADYVAEMVREKMIARYGEKAYTEGYKVYTTITSDRQHAAMTAVRHGLVAYDGRHEWRGARTSLAPEVLADSDALKRVLAELPEAGWLVPAAVMAVEGDHMLLQTRQYGRIKLGANDNPWLDPGDAAAQLASRGDVLRLLHENDPDDEWELAQIPQVQGALVSLDADTGAIEAIVGGFDFGLSEFNRATDAYRQPGSAIKPFIYATALANGFTAASLINDAPVVYGVYSQDTEDDWRPENYSHNIHGPTRLREGVVHSRNLMTVRLLRAVGIGTAVDYLARFGLPRDHMPRDLTLALGSATFTPLQMATGYAVMANGGYRVTPYLIDKIVGDGGNIVYQATPEVACQQPDGCSRLQLPGSGEAQQVAHTSTPKHDLAPRVITADNAYIISDIMRDVINRGTGGAARVIGRSDLSGKTGTSDNTTNAWFVGFNAELVAVTWVGFDRPRTLGWGETGAHAALPIWINYMRQALAGVPKSLMPRPENIVQVLIEPQTGQRALDGSGMAEIFKRGTQPTVQEARTYRGFNPADASDRLF